MQILRLLILLLLLSGYPFVFQAIAQSGDSVFSSPYRLSWKLDVPLSSFAVTTGVTYLILDSQTPSLSDSYINSLNRNDIWTFDRDASYNWSPPVAIASDALLYTSFAIPLTLFADKRIRKDYLKIGLIYAETFALTAAITSLTKNLVKRPRPFVYNQNVAIHFKKERSAQYSFFSGHTSITAAMCFMTAKIFNDYNKGHKAAPWIWASAAVIPAVTGILRQQAGKHFWSDVISGYLIGAAIGILVPELHRNNFVKKKKRIKPDVEF
jgi:membrane-associated phospholipid phosphatase